jgi:hypothetical protein
MLEGGGGNKNIPPSLDWHFILDRYSTYILQHLIDRGKALVFLPMKKTRLMVYTTPCQQGWPFILQPGLAFRFHFIGRISRNGYEICLLFL